MDRSAIEAIRDMAALTQDNLDTDIPARIVPTSHSIKSLEPYGAAPMRFRNRYSTDDVESFITYVNDNKTDDSVIYIDSKQMQATCIFDHGDDGNPLWGDHTGTLKMEPTPEYAALLESNGQPMTQQQFIDWYHDWAPFIKFVDQDGENLSSQNAINAVRRLNISMAREASSVVQNFGSEKSALEKVEVKSTITLPGEMVFSCHPFPHLNQQFILCRIAIRADDKPMVGYHIIGLRNMEHGMALEMSDKLRGATDIKTYLGKTEHGLT